MRRCTISGDCNRGDCAFNWYSCCAATEHDADFEQPDVARHMGKIMLDPARKSLQRAGSEERLAFRKRIEHAHTVLAGISDERNRTNLEQAGIHERTCHASTHHVRRRFSRIANAERPQLVREGIVATQTSHFLE